MTLAEQLQQQRLQDWLRDHPRLLVITGAGCSTEVGIPDYRDAAGQWKRPQPVTYQAFMGKRWCASATGRGPCWAGA